MMTLIGDCNVCIVDDVTNGVFGAIDVEDRDSVAQRLKREFFSSAQALLMKIMFAPLSSRAHMGMKDYLS